MEKKIIIGVLIIVVAAVAGFMIVKSKNGQISDNVSQSTQLENSQSPSDATQSSESATSSTAEVKEFAVSGSSYKFEPSAIKAKKGDTVKITFTNSGGMHDFVIDDFNVRSKTLKSGASETVQFTADKTGTFEFYCSVGNHRAMGMKGALTVE